MNPVIIATQGAAGCCLNILITHACFLENKHGDTIDYGKDGIVQVFHTSPQDLHTQK